MTEYVDGVIDKVQNFTEFEKSSVEKRQLLDQAIGISKKTAVVMNLVDHASLISAVLLTLLLRKTCGEVTLTDIRDHIPDADEFIWVGVAPNSVKDELNHANQKEHTFLLEDGDDPLISVCLDYIEPEPGRRADVDLCRRFIFPSSVYMEREASLEDLEFYSRILTKAYRFYLGEVVTLKDFHDLQRKPEEEQQEWLAQQKDLSTIVHKKIREVTFGKRRVFLVTLLGEEVYAILRRLKLSGKEYLHLSSGLYGQVAFASIPMGLHKEGYISSLIVVSPKNAGLTRQMKHLKIAC